MSWMVPIIRFPDFFCIGVPVASRVGHDQGLPTWPWSPISWMFATIFPSKNCNVWPRRSTASGSGFAIRPSSSPSKGVPLPRLPRLSAAACAPSRNGSHAITAVVPRRCGSDHTPDDRPAWPGRAGAGSISPANRGRAYARGRHLHILWPRPAADLGARVRRALEPPGRL